MSMRRKRLVYIASIIFFVAICMSISNRDGFTQGSIEQKVEDALTRYRTIGDPDRSDWLAELGEPAVSILMEKLNQRYSRIIVDALGKIGDERATPLLVRMLSEAENNTRKQVILRAIERIGDPSAESSVLSIFEGEKQDGNLRLLAAKVLLKIGGEESRNAVKEFVERICSFWEKSVYWFDDEAHKELEGLMFGDPGLMLDGLGEVVAPLKDMDILIQVMRWGGGIDECKALAEIGTPETIEVLYKAAENDESMWPPNIPPGVTESEREEFQRVNPYTRLAAVESLLTVSGVDTDRVTQAFEDIPTEELRELPLTIKLQPDKWNYQWKKAKDEGEGEITSYLGNIPGDYSVRDILPETIRLNGKVTPSKKGKKEKIQAKIKRHRKGFIGEVLEVKFNKFEAIKSIKNIWPGKECIITITGRLTDDKPLTGSYRIQISKP